jgi:hypothetical protein
MQFSTEQLILLLTILDTYIPVAAPYTPEDHIEAATQLRDAIFQEIVNDR